MQVSASNFKAYDIRGIVDEAIDDDLRRAPRAARSAARPSRPARRRSRSAATAALSGPAPGGRADHAGCASTGLDVVDLGAVTTPMLYYVAATRGKHGCH